jgi:hypothetical protein
MLGESRWDGAMRDLTHEPVIVVNGGVYIGIMPLDPSDLGRGSGVLLWQDGEEAVLSIVNYEGPPKQFWEYKSLSGPFWKGNICNGFAIWIAPRSDYATPEEIARALEDTSLSDEIAGNMRRITFGEVTLEYDLREMWP